MEDTLFSYSALHSVKTVCVETIHNIIFADDIHDI